MPHELDLGKPPAGYCVTGGHDGEQVEVQVIEFTSTEDGQHFIQRLEGIPTRILEALPSNKRVLPSQVDSLLAIIRHDGKATVYVNEVVQRAKVRVIGSAKAGQTLTKNHIADISRLELGVEVPNDCGVIYVFSCGWRKGLFYDFTPIGGPNRCDRTYDLFEILGRAHAYVLFQERFSITEEEWTRLFAAKWFPFAALRNSTIENMLSYLRSGWSIDELIDQIVTEVKERASSMLVAWRAHPAFVAHIPVLEAAVRHFQASEYLSSAGLLFPRIEGILRSYHAMAGAETKPSQEHLPRSAVSSRIDNPQCLLLPHRFEKYLREVYFQSFDPSQTTIEVGRHSVSHGMATAALLDQKSAAIGVLIVHQLFYCFDTTENVLDAARDLQRATSS